MAPAGRLAKRFVLEVGGWLLTLGGLAALVLPGPGLLMLFAGLLLLSQRYTWAERRVKPVKARAMRAARDGVRTWPRILVSSTSAICLVLLGLLWGRGMPAPEWWPFADRWWMPGGWGTGTTLVVSGLVAFALVVYSVRRFRGSGAQASDA